MGDAAVDLGWSPDPSWKRLPGGSSPATEGVWWDAASATVVKRLRRPLDDDPAELHDRNSHAWWRRPAEIAAHGVAVDLVGVRALPSLAVREDPDGITLVEPYVAPEPTPGLFVARCLGRLAGSARPEVDWLARRQLEDRLARVAARGGWSRLGRVAIGPVAEQLWRRRDDLLGEIALLPQVVQHGDPVPANLPGRWAQQAEATMRAIDWSTFGIGPVGADLGYYALSAREEFEPLLEAYLAGLPRDLASRGQVRLGAQVSAVYTLLTSVDRALADGAAGADGAADGGPAPDAIRWGPYLRALHRQHAQIEALLAHRSSVAKVSQSFRSPPA